MGGAGSADSTRVFFREKRDGVEQRVLVQRGFYRFIRHPAIAGIFLAYICSMADRIRRAASCDSDSRDSARWWFAIRSDVENGAQSRATATTTRIIRMRAREGAVSQVECALLVDTTLSRSKSDGEHRSSLNKPIAPSSASTNRFTRLQQWLDFNMTTVRAMIRDHIRYGFQPRHLRRRGRQADWRAHCPNRWCVREPIRNRSFARCYFAIDIAPQFRVGVALPSHRHRFHDVPLPCAR